jgi:hypothetical protein
MSRARIRLPGPRRRARPRWLGVAGVVASCLGLGLAAADALWADGPSALAAAAVALAGAGVLLAALAWLLGGIPRLSAAGAVVGGAALAWVLGAAALSAMPAGAAALLVVQLAVLLVFFGTG